MALTILQKRELDKVVSALVGVVIEEEKEFAYKEFLEEVRSRVAFDLTVQSIVASIRRVLPGNATMVHNHRRNTYQIHAYSFYMNKNFTKDHSLITFNNNMDLGIRYDFIEKTFNCDIENTRIRDKKLLLDLIEANAFDYEWMWNYTNNVYSILDILDSEYAENDNLKSQPKGLHQYLTNNGYELNIYSIRSFYRRNFYGNFNYNFTEEVLRQSFDKMDKLLEIMGNTDILKKIMVSTVKNGEVPSLSDMRNLVDAIISYEIHDILDGNRTLNYNIKLYKSILESRKNEKLQRQLQKLNFINGLEFNDYIVVVPQTVEEKADEGKQQNNCVGYFYDRSIAQGVDFIYFLREKKNPKKSLITCRYNAPLEETVEYRGKNNTSVSNETVIEVLKEIDNIIKENLK